MADVAEREGVAVICRDSSRLRDDVNGVPVLGFAGSSEPNPMLPVPRRNLPRGFNGLGARPRGGRFDCSRSAADCRERQGIVKRENCLSSSRSRLLFRQTAPMSARRIGAG